MPRKPERTKAKITKTEEGSVYYEKSLTKNLGNYESAKITIGVTLPVEPSDDLLDRVQATFELADDLISKELEIQVKDVIEGV